ncbi:hypothetical protein [Leptospira sp. 'Mane']|uniref:hypothetical protein n=1 Tax=Leptospira sp. 'Mane' TaxID=3387407 RepID=UPI00398BA6EE
MKLKSKIDICKLCQENKTLAKSHIIPEFWYESLYNKNGKYIKPDFDRTKGLEILQNGIKEPLLCVDCEGFLNSNYEQPIHQFWKKNVNIHEMDFSEQFFVLQNLNYSKFKLYHLCNLWRANHSINDMFNQVQLGSKHEGKIRTMLINEEPGPEIDYPILGSILFRRETGEVMDDMMISPSRTKTKDGHVAYNLLYGGIYWWIGVSSHIRLGEKTESLTKDGKMILHKSFVEDDPRIIKKAVKWSELFSEVPESLLK